MDDESYLRVIEQLNKEKQELKVEQSKHLEQRFSEILKKGIFGELYKIYLRKKRNSIVNEKYFKPGTRYSKERNNINYRKMKIVAYTCVTGGYDMPQLPMMTFDNLDYVLYTDTVEKYSNLASVYKIMNITNFVENYSSILANRYIKLHPSELFQDYDFAIYLDGNVRIVSDIRQVINYCSSSTGIAMHLHRERDCAYDEAEVCKILNKGNKDKIDLQMTKYKNAGFPRHFGLNEASVIVSSLHSSIAIELMDMWWEEFLASGSYRDQLAWPYILWKNNYSIEDVGCLGTNIYKNYIFEMIKHC